MPAGCDRGFASGDDAGSQRSGSRESREADGARVATPTTTQTAGCPRPTPHGPTLRRRPSAGAARDDVGAEIRNLHRATGRRCSHGRGRPRRQPDGVLTAALAPELGARRAPRLSRPSGAGTPTRRGDRCRPPPRGRRPFAESAPRPLRGRTATGDPPGSGGARCVGPMRRPSEQEPATARRVGRPSSSVPQDQRLAHRPSCWTLRMEEVAPPGPPCEGHRAQAAVAGNADPLAPTGVGKSHPRSDDDTTLGHSRASRRLIRDPRGAPRVATGPGRHEL